MALLEVKNLRTTFRTEDGLATAVNGLSFCLEAGSTLGIVGESGSGKSVASLSIMRLINPPGKIENGEIFFNGADLLKKSDGEMRKIRGKEIAMIFQDPMTSLNPVLTVGEQVAEAVRLHLGYNHKQARRKTIEMFEHVRIPAPEKRIDDYPHQFSGGMRQRVMIAMALSCSPRLIIADEPTTALDVTVQGQILDLLAGLQKEFNSAIIMITHDLGVIAQVADRVMVMYGGKPVEEGGVAEVMTNPQHPYTWGLLNSVPTLHSDASVDLRPIAGNPPSLLNVPSGCTFHPRCSYMLGEGSACVTQIPTMTAYSEVPEHVSACHLPESTRRRIIETEVQKVEEA